MYKIFLSAAMIGEDSAFGDVGIIPMKANCNLTSLPQ